MDSLGSYLPDGNDFFGLYDYEVGGHGHYGVEILSGALVHQIA